MTSIIPRWPGRGTEEELRPQEPSPRSLSPFTTGNFFQDHRKKKIQNKSSEFQDLPAAEPDFYFPTKKNGSDDFVSVLEAVRKEADEDTDGWAAPC